MAATNKRFVSEFKGEDCGHIHWVELVERHGETFIEEIPWTLGVYISNNKLEANEIASIVNSLFLGRNYKEVDWEAVRKKLIKQLNKYHDSFRVNPPQEGEDDI